MQSITVFIIAFPGRNLQNRSRYQWFCIEIVCSRAEAEAHFSLQLFEAQRASCFFTSAIEHKHA